MSRIYTSVLLIFIFVIPISQFVSVRLQVVLLLFTFFIGKPKNIVILFFKRSWDIILYLFVLTMGLFYTQDISSGLKILETNFSLLALPIILSRIPSLDDQLLRRAFGAFLIGLIVAAVICLIAGILQYNIDHNIRSFFFDNFTEPINSHPTYFAYYLICAISVLLYFLYYDEENNNTLLKYSIVLFLFFTLILTGGQTAFISFLFVCSFFILKYLTEDKARRKGAVVGLIAVMLACMFLVAIVEKENPSFAMTDSWERVVLWESAMAAVSNPLFGVGTGDNTVALNEYYSSHNLTRFALESYNSHNQLIQLLFSNGFFGVLTFILMLGRPLYFALRNKNILAILCIFPFLIYGMTEVFLGRYQGIVFFVLLHQVFIIDMTSEGTHSIIQKGN